MENPICKAEAVSVDWLFTADCNQLATYNILSTGPRWLSLQNPLGSPNRQFLGQTVRST